MKIRTIVGVFVVSALMLSSIGVAVAEGNGEKQGGHQGPADPTPGDCECWEGPPWDQTASITVDSTADCCRDRHKGRCCK